MTVMHNPQGSLWNRWDPHIHAPGTVLNNQYGGLNPWEEFLVGVETSSPTITALGVTDYLSVDLYERVLQEKSRGRLPNVGLIFPNVEMRFGIATSSQTAINFHLLVSPDNSDHVAEIRRFLLGLTFTFSGEEYRCERGELIRLGRAFDSSLTDERRALVVGTTQFKVNHDQLRSSFRKSEWAQGNILIAVAGGSRDGTSGMQENASFSALRRELQRDAHLIFSSQIKQREFWLGNGSVSALELAATYGGRKPCLHGSDAHTQAAVGNPAADRFCWIKGDVTFESLRQACLEPANRAFVGVEPPQHALPSQTIARLSVTNAPWFATPDIPLNPGLVAVIGARGSGKTALADLVAAAATALSPQLSERSFVSRAAKLLGDAKATLHWADTSTTENELKCVEMEEIFDEPHVRYLSQQFVDQLCSSEGLTDSLVDEVERVIFQAHSADDRMGATSFTELRELKTSALRSTRQEHEAAIAECSSGVVAEQARKDSLDELRSQQKAKSAAVHSDKRDRQSLLAKGQAERGQALEKVSDALDKVRTQVDAWTRRHQPLTGLRDEIIALRKIGAPATLRRQQNTYPESGLTATQWQALLINVGVDADKILADALQSAQDNLTAWKGPRPSDSIPGDGAPIPAAPLIVEGVELAQQSAALLNAEASRLRGLIGIDAANSKKYDRLSEKIAKEEVAIAKLKRDIELAEKADARIAELTEARAAAYRGVFEAIEREARELSILYRPLQDILQAEGGTLGKLGFSIRRVVDLDSWATHGENLFDLRASGPFRGKGALLLAAKDSGVLEAWQTGAAETVATTMAAFRKEYGARFVEQCPVDRKDRHAFREWILKVFRWLYSTDHITVSYGVQYESVLLLLYLSIDLEDDRPLIIDQPEENLDPKSIYDELVWRFKTGKQRRQIIIVTHNANLVVNADADQMIVATASSHLPGELPTMSYTSGGLENPYIRKQVCDILEGGAAAFQERAKRLRVSLPDRYRTM
jgi:energy-coupling factor transporter ATP-binding protein EcfA2